MSLMLPRWKKRAWALLKRMVAGAIAEPFMVYT